MAQKSTKKAPSYADIWNPFSLNEVNPFVYVTGIQAIYAKAMLELQIEQLDFLKERFSKDLVFFDQLTKTNQPPDVLSCFSSFFKDAVDDYSKETVKAANYSSRVAADAASKLKSQTEELTNDKRPVSAQVT